LTKPAATTYCPDLHLYLMKMRTPPHHPVNPLVQLMNNETHPSQLPLSPSQSPNSSYLENMPYNMSFICLGTQISGSSGMQIMAPT
jgi:hypothetical protein